MYVTIRRYADKGALIDGLVPLVNDGFVPLLKRTPGFKSYCVFASEDGHAVSVTIFNDRQTALGADDRVRERVVSNLRDLLPNPPEVFAGEVLLHRDDLQNGSPDMFATIHVYDGVGANEEVLPMVQEHIFPIITGVSGFRSYYIFLDEQRASRAVSVSLFDNREQATAVQETVVATMRDKRIAPNRPEVMAGMVAVVAVA